MCLKFLQKSIIFSIVLLGKVFPAYKKWTDSFLVENFGELEVKLEHKTEKKKTPVGERGVGRDTIRSFLETYKEKSSYIVSQLPDPMAEDVFVPPFMMCGTIYDRLLESNLWLSAGGTKSLLHRDADHAINCLLNGTKDWILIDPKQEADVCYFIKSSKYSWKHVLEHFFGIWACQSHRVLESAAQMIFFISMPLIYFQCSFFHSSYVF